LQKENNDWVKKCMVDEKGLVERLCKDCQACKLNRDDALDHSRWRKLIKDG